MDSRQFAATVSRNSGLDSKTVALAIESVVTVLSRECAALSVVAIPGFGNFIPEKKDEEISVDPVTLDRTLLPPSVSVTFRPSVILRKRINESQS